MPPADRDDPPTLRTPGAGDSSSASWDPDTKPLDGYAFGKMIGKGGIGEVVEAHDLRIGRDVAIKRLRTQAPTEDEVGRFLREARIQARLDHPAIPPVHELGKDKDGRPYFTMKKITGATLLEIFGSPQPNRQRLLRAFADVCLAIEFAHARGIVHRDLKPANIILGDFGDVYVIDWGLSRVVGEAVAEVVHDDIDSLEPKTGDVLGTPGYMAPEQLQQAALAGRPADVYSLGAILFEMLAGEPLHKRGATALASTLSAETVTSPAKRRADRAIPPELDSLCVSMVLLDPTLRPTARRVAERVQAYLDGDRDVARRREMAVDLVWGSRHALEKGNRADAMRIAGRALALDPDSAGAAELVTTLMLEPPEDPPPELRDALRATAEAGISRHARTAILAYLVIASFLPVAAWNGVRKWDVIMSVFAAAMVMAFSAYRILRQPRRSTAEMLAYAFGNACLLGLMTRMLGPFTFVPAIACIVVMSCAAYPQFGGRRAFVLIGVISLGFLVPFVLEQTGVIEHTWDVVGNDLVNHPGALAVSGNPTIALLVAATFATISIAGVHAARIYGTNREAQHQLATQAWHLRQLLPAAGSSDVNVKI
jgi:serine/threonine-protein kinase